MDTEQAEKVRKEAEEKKKGKKKRGQKQQEKEWEGPVLRDELDETICQGCSADHDEDEFRDAWIT